MASNALIQGARDIGRANLYDPYKFQAWIRSMFYGLDKLDDRMYAERMNGISQMARIQKEAAKVRENIVKQQKAGLDEFNTRRANVTSKANPGQRSDINPQILELYNQYVYLTELNQGNSPLSKEYSDNSTNMELILDKLQQWSGLLNNYQEYTNRLNRDLSNDGDATISDVHRYKFPMYYNIINDDHHRIQFFTNADGNEDMAIVFDNPYGEEIYHLGEPLFTENGKDVYGLVWSEFLSSGKADYYLKNRGQDQQMTDTWNKLRKDVTNGKGNMFIIDPENEKLLDINTKENFSANYPWDVTIRAPLTLEDGTLINQNSDANLLSMIYDFDPDGVGGSATTYRESVEWAAIQDFYISHYLPRQTKEYKNKVWRAQNWGYGEPEWTLDPDFAFGEVDIPLDWGITVKDPVTKKDKKVSARLGGPNSFAGRDLASHAFNIYIGDATYTALLPDARKYINEENARRLDKITKDQNKNQGTTGTEGYSLELKDNLGFIGSAQSLLEKIEDDRATTLSIDKKFVSGLKVESQELVLEQKKNRAATLSNMTGRTVMTIEDAYAIANKDIIAERKDFDAQSEEVKQAVIDDPDYGPPPVPPTLEEWIKESKLTASRGGYVIRRKDKLGWENFNNKLFNKTWGAYADDGEKITQDQLVKLVKYLSSLKGFDAPIGHITGSENWKNFKTEFENWSQKYNQ